ncbi:hypothetical protein EYF80_029581 [Liparis tanakae]|uniref:Uncharacterized protein n=1 Tax=Liparis tanakae TaxID=230148 RepID=A0A4Z2H365_9TELE|nr:hypothetical protein EYF80_029581 [Liparis tanakae]
MQLVDMQPPPHEPYAILPVVVTAHVRQNLMLEVPGSKNHPAIFHLYTCITRTAGPSTGKKREIVQLF